MPPADLAGLSVPLAGSLEQTSDPWLPYRMIDPAGVPVEAVSAFFGDLQAAGRSEATARSYGMDLLRGGDGAACADFRCGCRPLADARGLGPAAEGVAAADGMLSVTFVDCCARHVGSHVGRHVW